MGRQTKKRGKGQNNKSRRKTCGDTSTIVHEPIVQPPKRQRLDNRQSMFSTSHVNLSNWTAIGSLSPVMHTANFQPQTVIDSVTFRTPSTNMTPMITNSQNKSTSSKMFNNLNNQNAMTLPSTCGIMSRPYSTMMNITPRMTVDTHSRGKTPSSRKRKHFEAETQDSEVVYIVASDDGQDCQVLDEQPPTCDLPTSVIFKDKSEGNGTSAIMRHSSGIDSAKSGTNLPTSGGIMNTSGGIMTTSVPVMMTSGTTTPRSVASMSTSRTNKTSGTTTPISVASMPTSRTIMTTHGLIMSKSAAAMTTPSASGAVMSSSCSVKMTVSSAATRNSDKLSNRLSNELGYQANFKDFLKIPRTQPLDRSRVSEPEFIELEEFITHPRYREFL